MAAEEFIKFFETSINETIISFKNFFKLDFFTGSTPRKGEIKYSGDINNLIKQVRNVIFTNLRLNKSFLRKPKYEREDIQPLYQLIKDTSDIINENQKAQLLLLLHLSKCGNAKKDTFRTFFNQIDSIKMADGLNSFYQEAKCLFTNLLKNKRIQMVISDVVREISGSASKNDFNIIKFRYFRSKIVGLQGFAGVNEIFVSVNELDYKIDELEYYSDEEKLKLFKLSFTALFIHEVTHVVLRSSMNDFNVSSLKAWDTSNENVEEEKRPSFVEAEIFAEKKLFKAVIDWEKSAESNFNLVYCSDFLEKLFKNEPVDFDLDEANITISKAPVLMAFDYSFEEQRFI